MKSYTDIEQSKKLAEFLPIESANMVYIWHATSDNPTFRFDDDMPPMVLKNVPIDKITEGTLPCWSLAALLDILSHPTLEGKSYGWQCCTYGSNKEGTVYLGGKVYSNPIDACYNMVLRLHELEML